MNKLLDKSIFYANVFGDKFVGKSSFISSVTSNDLEKRVVLRDKLLDNNIIFEFHEENYEILAESICIILIYDITNENSFQNLKQKFCSSIKEKLNKEKNFVILIGNKTDLELQRISEVFKEAEQFASQNGMFFLETSAKSNKNIELVQKVMRIRSSHLIKKHLSASSAGGGLLASSGGLSILNTGGFGSLTSNLVNQEKTQNTMLLSLKNETSIFSNSKPISKSNHDEEINYPRQMDQELLGRRDLHGIDLSLVSKSSGKKKSPKKIESIKKSPPKQSTDLRFSCKENRLSTVQQFHKENGLNRDFNILKDLSNGQDINRELSFSQSPEKIIQPKEKDTLKESLINIDANLFSKKDYQAKSAVMMSHDANENSENTFERRINGDNRQNSQANQIENEKLSALPIKNLDNPNVNTEDIPDLPPRDDNPDSLFEITITGNDNQSSEFAYNPMDNPGNNSINHSTNRLNNSTMNNTKKELSMMSLQFRSNRSQESNHPTFMESRFHEDEHHFNENIPPQLDNTNSMLMTFSAIPKEIDIDRIKSSKNFQSDFFSKSLNIQKCDIITEQDEPSQISCFIGSSKPYLMDKENNEIDHKGGNTNIQSKNLVELGSTECFSLRENNNIKNHHLNGNNKTQSNKLYQPGIIYPNDNGGCFDGGYSQKIYPEYNKNCENFKFLDIDDLYNQEEYTCNNVTELKDSKSEEINEIDQNIKEIEESLVSLDRNLNKKDLTQLFNQSMAEIQSKNIDSPIVLNNSSRINISNTKNNKKRPKSIETDKNKALLEDITNQITDNNKNISVETAMGQVTKTSAQKNKKESNNTPRNTAKKIIKPYQYLVQNSYNTFNPGKKPVLFLHLENITGEIDVLPVYADDTSFQVAERYYSSKNQPHNDHIKLIANLIEDKINTISMEYDDLICKYESSLIKEKNHYDNMLREKLLKEAKAFDLLTEKRTQRSINDMIIGKIYVELENKKIVVLNIRHVDDPYETASKFVATYSLKRELLKLLLDYIQEIREIYEEKKKKKDFSTIIKNLIIKSTNFTTQKEIELGTKESVSPIKNLHGGSNSKSPKSKSSKVLFKVNFDIGNGRVSKIAVREGDNLSKVAHNFVITYKLGNNAYEKIKDVLEKTYKAKISNNLKDLKNLEHLIYLQD